MRLGALYCKGARAGDRMSSGGLAFVLISLLYCCTPRYRTADLRYLVVGQSQVVTIKFGTF